MKPSLFTVLIVPILFAEAIPEKEYLKVTQVKGASVLVTGKSGEAVITSTIVPGFHVQANPVSQPTQIPTQLTFESNDAFEIGVVQYPEGKKYKQKDSDRELLTYEGAFEIKVPIKAVPGKANLGKNELVAKLRYQACDEKICFFPNSVRVVVPVMVYK